VRAAYERGDDEAVWRWVGLSGRSSTHLADERVTFLHYARIGTNTFRRIKFIA
jgi:hypothetical protein